MFRCTSRCVTCQEVLESDSFKSHSTGAHHKIQGHITYYLQHNISDILQDMWYSVYIGETKNSLNKQFYGHRSTVKTHKLDTPVSQHFNLPNHSISDMILQGIEALANRRESVHLSREKIRRVHTIHPMVSYIMTNLSPFFFLHRNVHIYFTFNICSTFVLLVSLFVGFVLHPLSDSLLFTNIIISSSSQNSWYFYSYLISFCPVP